MAIRELSHERRNIMIPKYWRHVHHYNDIALNKAANGLAWVLINANYTYNLTVYQDELVRVHFHAYHQRIGVAGWQYCSYRILKTAAAIGRGAVSSADVVTGVYLSCDARGLITQTAAEGAVTYQVQYQVSAAAKWTMIDAEWDIAIARD